MKIRWFIAILFASVLVTGLLYAGSVYYWMDENGVRHYSNTGIPNDVEAADVRRCRREITGTDDVEPQQYGFLNIGLVV